MLKTKPEPIETFGLRPFTSDILVNSVGRGTLLVFGFVQGIIIPKFLPLEAYGYWQIFMLYAGYAGILHFGAIEGILLSWAGKDPDKIRNKMGLALRFLLFQEVIVILPLCFILFFALKPPFEWIALMTLIYALIFNMSAFFQYSSQAFRKFKTLTTVNIATSLVFIIAIICLFAFGFRDYTYTVYSYLLASVIGFAAFWFLFRRYFQHSEYPFHPTFSYGKELIKVGIFVYLGDIITALFLSIDRLTVSSFFPIDQFATYAFALTVAMIGYAFVTAVSQVFFPYLSAAAPKLRIRAYRIGKPILILAWACILAIYFPVAWLVWFYLPHYTTSLPIMQILLCTVGFGSMIQILHISYYMAYRKQRQYFLYGIAALAVLAVLVFAAVKIWGTLESVAIATLVGFVVWYIINELSLKSIVRESNRGLWKSFGIICSYVAAFWVSFRVTDRLVMQMIVYICLFALLTWLFSRHTIKELIVIANEIRGQRR